MVDDGITGRWSGVDIDKLTGIAIVGTAGGGTLKDAEWVVVGVAPTDVMSVTVQVNGSRATAATFDLTAAHRVWLVKAIVELSGTDPLDTPPAPSIQVIEPSD